MCLHLFVGCPTMAAVAALAPPAKRVRLSKKSQPACFDMLREVGHEDQHANQSIYLVTISRVLSNTSGPVAYRDLEVLATADLIPMFRDAFDDPLPLSKAGGRPRADTKSKVELVVAVKEAHADGSAHFHVVVKLNGRMRFKQAKLTLQVRCQLPSHWSCSHTQLWSAIRYIHVPSPKKPVVDTQPHIWTKDGASIDLVELSREPFVAMAWRKRRETAEAKAIVKQEKVPSFNKLDLIALVLSKHLHTKNVLLSYTQQFGSPAAQLFVSKHQRKLAERLR